MLGVIHRNDTVTRYSNYVGDVDCRRLMTDYVFILRGFVESLEGTFPVTLSITTHT